jgi:hypothetical protein
MHACTKSLFTTIALVTILVASAGYSSATDGPDAVKLDSLSNIYEGVNFDHLLHVDVAACGTCHHHTLGTPTVNQDCLRCHKNSGPVDEVACTGCHPSNPCNPETREVMKPEAQRYHLERTGLKRAYHRNCLGCHYEQGAPTGCEDCHVKKGDGEESVEG